MSVSHPRRIRLRLRLLAVAALALLGPALHAQQTLTPAFSAPYRAFDRNEFGATFSSPGDLALEGFYGYGAGGFDVSLRAGFLQFGDGGTASPNDGGTAALLGAQLRQRIVTYSNRFPLDGAVTVGLGGRFGEGTDVVFLPVGLTLGRRFQLDGSRTSFVPYVQPYVGAAFSDDDTSLEAGVGLGVDIRIGRQVDLRVSGGLGYVEGVAVGLAFLR